MDRKATAREIAQGIEIKNLRSRIQLLQDTREDADKRASYYWHLYLDSIAELGRAIEKSGAKEKQYLASELELGLALDRITNAALLMYEAYNGRELEYVEYEQAERAIINVWDEFQNEGTDEKQTGRENGSRIELPF